MLSKPQSTMTKTLGQDRAQRQHRPQKVDGLYLKAFNEFFLELLI